MLEFHWATVADAEWAADHPCYGSHKDVRQWCFPIRLHGDDASIKTQCGRKLCIVSVHSEFCSDDPLDSRLLSLVAHDDQLVSGVTLWEYGDILKWSYDALLSGVHPCSDHRGQP